MDPESEKQKLWEEARQWAVAEILAKYRKELKEAHSRQFIRLRKRADELRNELESSKPLDHDG